MYFKIVSIIKDKYTDMGMVNISASFYLEEGDEGWDKYQKEHHVIVPIFPPEGYPRQIELDAERKNDGEMETKGEEAIAYDKWLSELPTEERDNPFCNHSIQFEHDATEEEILWCFEWALAQTHLNYLDDDLHCKTTGKVVNQSINYIARKAFYEGVKTIPVENQSNYEKSELAKCVSAESKVIALKDVDFTAVETVESYNVRK